MGIKRYTMKTIKYNLLKPDGLEEIKNDEDLLNKYIDILIEYSKQPQDSRVRRDASYLLNKIMSNEIKDGLVNKVLKKCIIDRGYNPGVWAENMIELANQRRDNKARIQANDRLAMVLEAKGFNKETKNIEKVQQNVVNINIEIKDDKDIEEAQDRAKLYENIIDAN